MKTETLKEAGYTYVKNLGDGEHLLKNSEGGLEIFAVSKNFAGWRLKFKNTHLEFCRSIEPEEVTLTTRK